MQDVLHEALVRAQAGAQGLVIPPGAPANLEQKAALRVAHLLQLGVEAVDSPSTFRGGEPRALVCKTPGRVFPDDGRQILKPVSSPQVQIVSPCPIGEEGFIYLERELELRLGPERLQFDGGPRRSAPREYAGIEEHQLLLSGRLAIADVQCAQEVMIRVPPEYILFNALAGEATISPKSNLARPQAELRPRVPGDGRSEGPLEAASRQVGAVVGILELLADLGALGTRSGCPPDDVAEERRVKPVVGIVEEPGGRRPGEPVRYARVISILCVEQRVLVEPPGASLVDRVVVLVEQVAPAADVERRQRRDDGVVERVIRHRPPPPALPPAPRHTARPDAGGLHRGYRRQGARQPGRPAGLTTTAE